MPKTYRRKQVATINGTEINLMPTKGMREAAERYREFKKRAEKVVQK